MTDEALFAVLRSSQYREIRTGSQADRYRSAWLSARQRAQSWRELYLSARRIVDELTDSVPMAYYRDVVKKYRREIDQRDTRIRVLRGERDHLAREMEANTLHQKNEELKRDADRLREELADLRLAHSELQGSQKRAVRFVEGACRSTRHCVNWGFCHRCAPELSSRASQLFEDTDHSSEAYAEIVRTLIDP